jgi:hypothetical protein
LIGSLSLSSPQPLQPTRAIVQAKKAQDTGRFMCTNSPFVGKG